MSLSGTRGGPARCVSASPCALTGAACARGSGDGDVDTTGECAADIKHFCGTTKPGEGRLAACLTNQQDAEAAGTAAGRTLSPECVAELRQYKVDRCAAHSAPVTSTFGAGVMR